MKINNKEVKTNGYFAYDGCHKIYILEDNEDEQKAKDLDYEILPIEIIKIMFDSSCSLRFISNWKLNTNYVRQFEEANFEK